MIRGSVRNHAPTSIESSWNANIHNRFDIEVRDAKTNQLKQKAQAFNVICNNFWSNLDTGFNYIAYSNGNGTPSASDTKTFGTWYAANIDSYYTTVKTDIKNGVSYCMKKTVLNEQTAVGVTITEVGLASSSYSGSLCTHAMLQDMNGNRISIKKTSTDILTIYATVYVHWVPSGQNGVILGIPRYGTNTANRTTFLDYVLGLGAMNHSLHTYAGLGTAVGGGMGSSGSTSWNASTKKWTCTFNRIGVNDCNVSGGIGWLMYKPATLRNPETVCLIDVRGEYEVLGESVGTGDGSTASFSTKFDMPTNAVVYVDGVAATSGVTVKPHPLNDNAMLYMLAIHSELYDNKPCPIGGPACCGADYGSMYMYNQLHEVGIGSFASSSYSSYLKFAFSDDFENWSPEYSTGVTIPSSYRNRKYIRVRVNTDGPWIEAHALTATFASGVSPKNIVFDTPPAKGSVITIDYTTPFVPKDSNHVYDLSIVVQLGEYTGN